MSDLIGQMWRAWRDFELPDLLVRSVPANSTIFPFQLDGSLLSIGRTSCYNWPITVFQA